MSLINEVLRKLDQKPASAGYGGMDLPPNLRPDQVRRTSRLIRWGLILAIAVAGGAGVGAGAFWLVMDSDYFAAERVAEKRAAKDKGAQEEGPPEDPPKKAKPEEEAPTEPPRPLLLRTALWDWPDAPPLPIGRQSPDEKPGEKQEEPPPQTVSAGSEMTKLRVAPPRHQHPRVSKVFTYPKGKRWPVAEAEAEPAEEKQSTASASEAERAPGPAGPTSQSNRTESPDAGRVDEAQQASASDASPAEKTETTGAEEAAGEDKVEVQLHPQTRRRRQGEQLASRGYSALQAGRLEEAVSLLRAAHERLPERSGVANNLALALWEQEHSAEAIRVLTDYLQRDPANERMARNLGHFLLSAPQAGPRDAARKALAKSAVKQGNVAVYILAGRVLHQDGRPEQAAEVLQLGEQRLGGAWRLAYERGRALAAADRVDDAQKAFERALASLPSGAEEPRQRVRSALEQMEGRD